MVWKSSWKGGFEDVRAYLYEYAPDRGYVRVDTVHAAVSIPGLKYNISMCIII